MGSYRWGQGGLGKRAVSQKEAEAAASFAATNLSLAKKKVLPWTDFKII
jgi:hypothetical protein